MDYPTPCIVVDYSKMVSNIARMQAACDAANCKLRPHIKTHKSVEIARLQVSRGAAGITCAKVSEAEVMAEGGLDDIFIAYPQIGKLKVERAVALAKKCKRLILAVDSIEGAEGLSRAAQMSGVPLEVRLEVDTGAKRTGATRKNAAELGVKISALPGLKLTGLFTFKSLILDGKPTFDAKRAAREECEILAEVKEELCKAGIEITDLSAGSTPTGIECAETGLVNEVRPGTYVFYDKMNALQGTCREEDVAAKIYATVVSAPTPFHAVIDGGSKVFPTDQRLNDPPRNFHSYAYIDGHIDGHDDLRFNRLSEEHGIISADGGRETGLTVGDILTLTPTHICTAVNLQNYIYMDKGGGELIKMPVDARGRVF